MSGTLYLVPTPIGNLNDMSSRAIEVLTHADLVACEDTRHSAKLLQHYNIAVPTISLHQHNEYQRSQYLLELLSTGKTIALISDAGTPLINDPGFELVRLCRQQQVNVIALPGPCAFVTALSASGIATDKFCFAGFFPVKKQAREQTLDEIKLAGITYIFYESPKRVLATLDTIDQCHPDMQVAIAKELTKTHEHYVGYNAKHIIQWLTEEPARQKGEFVLIMRAQSPQKNNVISSGAEQLLQLLTNELPPKKAAMIVAKQYNLDKKILYDMLVGKH